MPNKEGPGFVKSIPLLIGSYWFKFANNPVLGFVVPNKPPLKLTVIPKLVNKLVPLFLNKDSNYPSPFFFSFVSVSLFSYLLS